MSAGYIYAVRAGALVKLGWSAKPAQRFVKIQSDNPLACELVGAVEGSQQDEHDLHQRLDAYCVRGEWYEMRGEVADFVVSLPPASATVKTVGNASPLRTWRGSRTLDECAALIGTTAATLSRIERGKQWVSRDLLHKIQATTGLTLSDILAREEVEPTEPAA